MRPDICINLLDCYKFFHALVCYGQKSESVLTLKPIIAEKTFWKTKKSDILIVFQRKAGMQNENI